MSHPNPPHWALSIALILLAYVLRFFLSVLLDIVSSTFPDLLILPYLWTYGFPYEKVWKRLRAFRAYYIQVCVQLRRLLLTFLFAIALSLGYPFVCSQCTTSSFTYKLLATISRLGYRSVRHILGFLFTAFKYILVCSLLEVIFPKFKPASKCPSDVTPSPPLPKFVPPTKRLYKCVHCLAVKQVVIDPKNKKTFECDHCETIMCRINLTNLDKGVNKLLLEPPPGGNVQHLFCEFCGTLHDVIIPREHYGLCWCALCNSELSRLPPQFATTRDSLQEYKRLQEYKLQEYKRKSLRLSQLQEERKKFDLLGYSMRPQKQNVCPAKNPMSLGKEDGHVSQKDSRENQNTILTTSTSEVGSLVEDISRVDILPPDPSPTISDNSQSVLLETPATSEPGQSGSSCQESSPSTSTPHTATSETLPLNSAFARFGSLGSALEGLKQAIGEPVASSQDAPKLRRRYNYPTYPTSLRRRARTSLSSYSLLSIAATPFAIGPFDETDTFGLQLDENVVAYANEVASDSVLLSDVDVDLLWDEHDMTSYRLLSASAIPFAVDPFDESDTFGLRTMGVESDYVMLSVDMDLLGDEHDLTMATPDAESTACYPTQAIEDNIYLPLASDPEANLVTISDDSSLKGHNTPTSKPDNAGSLVSSSVIKSSTPIGGSRDPVSNGAKGWDDLMSHPTPISNESSQTIHQLSIPQKAEESRSVITMNSWTSCLSVPSPLQTAMTSAGNMTNALTLIDSNLKITTGAIPPPRATPPPGNLKKEENLRIKALESMRKAREKKNATAS